MKMKKSSNISATALHRFIPQPASGRSSALPCLAANIVLSKLLWEIHLHSLKFIPFTLSKSDFPRVRSPIIVRKIYPFLICGCERLSVVIRAAFFIKSDFLIACPTIHNPLGVISLSSVI